MGNLGNLVRLELNNTNLEGHIILHFWMVSPVRPSTYRWFLPPLSPNACVGMVFCLPTRSCVIELDIRCFLLGTGQAEFKKKMKGSMFKRGPLYSCDLDI